MKEGGQTPPLPTTLHSKLKNIEANSFEQKRLFRRFLDWTDWFSHLISVYHVKPRVVVLLGGESWPIYREVCFPEWSHIPIVLGGVKQCFIDYKQLHDGGYTQVG